MVARKSRRDVWVAGGLAIVSFVLYALAAAPSVATIFDDSLEFQVVLPTLGIAHPSGYPLYTLLGYLFTRIVPFGDPAGALNLLSALFAALAVGVLYLAARRLAGSAPAAATAVAIFAISPTWWSQATLAEVYTLHGLLVALFIYFLLRWEEGRAVGGSDGYLRLAALTCGLGLAHHRMIALLLPAALVFIFWTDRTLIRQPRRWLAPIALGLAPLLLYLYLPLRGQAVTSLDGTYAPTLRGTVDWVLARPYSVFVTGNPFNIERGFADYLALFLAELGVLTLIAALMGIWRAWSFSNRRTVFLLLATVAQLAFGAIYKVEDIAVFFIPAFMLVTLWAAWGLTPFFDSFALRANHAIGAVRVPALLRAPLLAIWMGVVALVMLFEPGRVLLADFATRNRSNERAVYWQGQDMIEQAAPDGRVVGLIGETTLVRYFRDVLKQHPAVEVAPADAETARYAAVESALNEGRPVYLTRDLPRAAQRYSLDAAGSLIHVSPKAPPATPQDGSEMGAGVHLLRAEAARIEGAGPQTVRVRLTWTATAPITEDLKVSVRAVTSDGVEYAAVDGVPVHFAYPTTAWVVGEPVDDVYDLRLDPPGQPAKVLVILYRASDGSEVGRYTLNLPKSR